MRRIFLILIVVLVSGCSTIMYNKTTTTTKPDGTVVVEEEKTSYSRTGSQNLNGVAIVKKDDEVAVQVQAQRTSTEEIANAVTKIADTAKSFVMKGE